MHRQQVAEDRGQRQHHSRARGYANDRSGEAEAHGLQQKNAQQIARPRADSLQNRQHIHPLLEVRMHRHRNTDRAQHHGDKTDQTQDGRCPVQTFCERRVTLAKIHHLRFGQDGLDLLANRGELRDSLHGRGQLDQQAFVGPASRSNEIRRVKRGT